MNKEKQSKVQPKYEIGQKIRYKQYSFSGKYQGYNEGYITKVEQFSPYHYHYNYIVTCFKRNWGKQGRMRNYPPQVGKVFDFLDSCLNPPLIIKENN